MSTPDGVMSFAQSQPCKMHFKNQHGLVVQGDGNVPEIKAFTVRRRAHPSRGAPAKAICLTPTADC